MPGAVSDSYPGPTEGTPYVPSWCYPAGPRMCPCGDHEGFHSDSGECLRCADCGCTGIPPECVTPPGEAAGGDVE